MVTPVIVSDPPIITDNGYMSIDFVASYEGYVLKDAIVGSADYISSLTAEEINTIEVDRFNAWYAIVTTPVEDETVVDEPIVEE
jgi:hypothetical protein